MIARIWQCWATLENADQYEHTLRSRIIPQILAKNIQGLHGIELLRREVDEEVEFMTIFRFENINRIKAMAGDDVEAAYVPEVARKILRRFDQRARHFESRGDVMDVTGAQQ